MPPWLWLARGSGSSPSPACVSAVAALCPDKDPRFAKRCGIEEMQHVAQGLRLGWGGCS